MAVDMNTSQVMSLQDFKATQHLFIRYGVALKITYLINTVGLACSRKDCMDTFCDAIATINNLDY